MKNVIKMVEGLLKYEDIKLRKFKSYGKQPLPNRSWPELEQIDELSPELASRYL